MRCGQIAQELPKTFEKQRERLGNIGEYWAIVTYRKFSRLGKKNRPHCMESQKSLLEVAEDEGLFGKIEQN
jgi:hypothetical protein